MTTEAQMVMDALLGKHFLVEAIVLTTKLDKEQVCDALDEISDLASVEGSVKLPGLRCPKCARIAFDLGGGRACYSGPRGPSVPCGVMQPIWLLAYPAGTREEESQ